MGLTVAGFAIVTLAILFIYFVTRPRKKPANVLPHERFMIGLELMGFERVQTIEFVPEKYVDINCERGKLGYRVRFKLALTRTNTPTLSTFNSDLSFVGSPGDALQAVYATRSGFSKPSLEAAHNLGITLWDAEKVTHIVDLGNAFRLLSRYSAQLIARLEERGGSVPYHDFRRIFLEMQRADGVWVPKAGDEVEEVLKREGLEYPIVLAPAGGGFRAVLRRTKDTSRRFLGS